MVIILHHVEILDHSRTHVHLHSLRTVMTLSFLSHFFKDAPYIIALTLWRLLKLPELLNFVMESFKFSDKSDGPDLPLSVIVLIVLVENRHISLGWDMAQSGGREVVIMVIST